MLGFGAVRGDRRDAMAAAGSGGADDAADLGVGGTLDDLPLLGGDSGTAELPWDAWQDVAGPEETSAPPEVLPEVNAGDDAAVDGGGEDASPGDGPAAGQVGSPCETAGECFSGWCLPSPDGLVCSKGCVEDCQPGWQCQSVTGPTGLTSFVCINPTALLCLPCLDNLQCNQAIAAGTNLCVSHGDEGSFCGLDCSIGGGCPDGYACEAVPAPGGGTSKQCVPTDGALCECSGLAVQLGNQTACATTNAFGSCAGARGCDAELGLEPCDAFVPDAEECDGFDDDCDGVTDELTGGGDCEVITELGACPGTQVCVGGSLQCIGGEAIDEGCNAIDDDCDGDTDEGFPDGDGDGIADCVDDDDDDDGWADGEDCAPHDPAINPEAQEVCDGDDEDCDGLVDEEDALGCLVWFQDVDGDLFGADAVPPRCLCEPDELGFFVVDAAGDCNDIDVNVKPGGLEHCNGADDDCDGETDEGFTNSDDDPVPDCADDDDDGDGFLDAEDCAPWDPAINPGATEVCDGADNDCDGLTDEQGAAGCTDFLKDADSDGQGSDSEAPWCLCAPDKSALYVALEGGDCNDLDKKIHTGAPEQCNGKDDDCDGFTDELFSDFDGDGSADCVDPDDDDDNAPDFIDCAPYDPTRSPLLNEICNGKDDDCNAVIDQPGAGGCSEYWMDIDDDGYGSTGNPSLCLCEVAPEIHYTATQGGDCDDANSARHPGADDVCNYVDDDCSGETDEGVQSPCNDCSGLCVVDIGPGGNQPFDPSPAAAVGLDALPSGELLLTSPPGQGTYTHILHGWPQSATFWDRLWIDTTSPVSDDGVGFYLRYRTAADELGLLVAPWEGPLGPFPLEPLPVDVQRVAGVIEIEVTIESSNEIGYGVLQQISIIAWEQ